MFRLSKAYAGETVVLMSRMDTEGLYVVGYTEKAGKITDSLLMEPLNDDQMDYYGGEEAYLARVIQEFNEGLENHWPDMPKEEVAEVVNAIFTERVNAMLRRLAELQFIGDTPRVREP